MAGLVPAIHDLFWGLRKTWMAVTSTAMTIFGCEVFEGVYLTRELILWYKRALEAGDPDALAPEAEVIRLAKNRSD